VRHGRDLLTDALDIVARIKNADRGVDVVQIDDELPQRGAGMGNLAGDLGALLGQPGEGVRPLYRHASFLLQ
jgi:hypothetical protein